MKEDRAEDLVFILYLLVIFALSVAYFTVPERAEFLSNAMGWWAEMLKIIL